MLYHTRILGSHPPHVPLISPSPFPLRFLGSILRDTFAIDWMMIAILFPSPSLWQSTLIVRIIYVQLYNIYISV